MKKKIAIIHNLPGGGGLRMLNAIIERYKQNCDIDVYVISEKFHNSVKGVNNINIKVYPWKGFILYNFWIMFILPLIHKKISKNYAWSKYDLIFASHDYYVKSPYILRHLRKKIIYLCQEPQREFYEPWNIHAPFFKDKIANIIRYPIKFIDEITVSHVSKIICNSQYSRKRLHSIYKKKCEIIYPGVDSRVFHASHGDKKNNMILCVGGINRVKGQDFVIRSLKPILKDNQLLLIGGGREEDIGYIKKIIGKNTNVVIKRDVSDAELIYYYKKARVTCIAAHFEPFGLSSIESQSCGTPVITIDDGGTKETIINGKSGYLSKRVEKEFLEKTMLTIKNCEKMKKDCLNNITKKWTWDITLKPLDKYFIF